MSLHIEQKAKDVIITMNGDFNLIIINKNSTNNNIKPRYPESLEHLPKDKEGFINYTKSLELYKEFNLIDVLSHISQHLYVRFIKGELTRKEYDIVDTHLLNFTKKVIK